jgi:hypothetical protein
MTHPTEEEMVDRYYSDAEAGFEEHLAICQECRALYRAICETLEMAADHPVPARGPDYGSQVWARVSAQLPAKARKNWLLVPALAAGLGVMFAAGMWTEHLRKEVPPLQVTFVHAPAPVLVQPAAKKPRPVRVLTDAEQDKKLLALNSLLEADAKSALPKVLAMVNGKTSDRTKEHALFVLAQSDSPDARAALMNIARDAAKPELQTKAVRMMVVMGEGGPRKEVAVPDRVTVFTLKGAPTAEKKQILNSVFLAANSQVLLDVLKKQPDAGVRAATIRSLAVMGERSNVLTDVYRTDSDDGVRRAVLDVLVVQQNGEALSELARDEPDAQRKKEILSRLATIGYRKIQRPPP